MPRPFRSTLPTPAGRACCSLRRVLQALLRDLLFERAQRLVGGAAHRAGQRGAALQQGVTGLVEGVVQTNLRAAQELFRLANPAPLVELQQRFAREYTDMLLRNSATLVRAMRRTADETLRPPEQQIAQQREQANQGGQGFQTAAE